MNHRAIDELVEASQCDVFWRPSDLTVVEREDVVYLSCPRDEAYLNSVHRVRSEDARVEALVREVSEAHAKVTSRFAVAEPSCTPALERSLAAAGYVRTNEHYAYTIAVGAYEPRPERGIAVRRVESVEDLYAFRRVMHEAFGRSSASSPAIDAHELALCTGPSARVARFVAVDMNTGAVIGCGGSNLYPKLRYASLWAGATLPSARGRGAYSALTAARVSLAKSASIERVGLYARLATSAPIVEAQGFARAGRMTYWERPPLGR